MHCPLTLAMSSLHHKGKCPVYPTQADVAPPTLSRAGNDTVFAALVLNPCAAKHEADVSNLLVCTCLFVCRYMR